MPSQHRFKDGCGAAYQFGTNPGEKPFLHGLLQLFGFADAPSQQLPATERVQYHRVYRDLETQGLLERVSPGGTRTTHLRLTRLGEAVADDLGRHQLQAAVETVCRECGHRAGKPAGE